MAIFNKKTSAFINRVYWSSRRALSFERVWSLPKNWFDAPNEARGGWSGVTRTEFDTRKGITKVFVKRQQNYYSRTWRHPFKGIPTFQKELENIQQKLMNLDLIDDKIQEDSVLYHFQIKS